MSKNNQYSVKAGRLKLCLHLKNNTRCQSVPCIIECIILCLIKFLIHCLSESGKLTKN